MTMNRETASQWFLVVVMFVIALFVQLLLATVSSIFQPSWITGSGQNFPWFCLSIAVGVIGAVFVGVNVNPSKAKPAVRFMMLPSTRRTMVATRDSGLGTTTTVVRAGQLSRALLVTGLIVLVVLVSVQLATGHLGAHTEATDGLFLVVVLVLLVVPKLAWLIGRDPTD